MDDRDLARLASCGLFSKVDIGAFKASMSQLDHAVREFRTGEVMMHSGSVCENLMVLLEGEVRAEMTNDEGKTFIVESLRAPQAIATAILFSPDRILPVTAIALVKTRVAVLRRQTLLELCGRHGEVLEALLGDMGFRLAFLADRLRATQFATLRERLSDWLVRRAELSGSAVIHLDTSKERLSELFGVARPSLSRELGELAKMGFIHSEGREIRILDIRALRNLRSR